MIDNKAASAEDWTPLAPTIPSRWSCIDFEEAFELLSLNKVKIPEAKYQESGVFPIVDQGRKFIGGYTNADCCVINREGQVIVFGDHTRCFKFVGFPFAPGADGTKVLRPRAGIVSKFAYYCCLSLKLPNRGYSRHYAFLRKSKFPIAPLAEQRRVVERIEELFSELDTGVEALRTAREQLDAYRQSVLKHAFEGKLTEVWRKQRTGKMVLSIDFRARLATERQDYHERLLADCKSKLREWELAGSKGSKPSRVRALKPIEPLSHDVLDTLSTLPDGWIWEKLAWMTCGVEYGTAAKSAKTGAVPVIRMGNLQNGRVDWDDLVFTSDRNEIEQYALQPGDVLFNRTNSPELVGKTAIYRGERPAVFAGYLIRVNHNAALVDGEYLNLFLNSYIARQHGNTVKTDGVNQSNINGEKLQNYPFPFCSLAEQQEIVRILDETLSRCDRLTSEIEEHLQRANALRHAILAKAFSGQLIAQNSKDEPASRLLERIRAEREGAVAKKERTPKNGKRKAA